MFSAFSGWVTSAADAVHKISDQGLDAVRQTGIMDALQNSTLQTSSAEATPLDHQLAVKDLMTPPATWTGSVDEWEWCVTAALNDANTCAITPATLKSDANLWQELHSLVAGLKKRDAALETDASTTAAAEVLGAVDGSYTPSADLVAFIQAHEAIYKVRSYVVPLFTSDEDYWLNIGWRLALYRQCTNAEDLLAVMRTASKLPASLHVIADAEKRAAEQVAAKRAAAARRADAGTERDDQTSSPDDEEDEDEDDEYVARSHLTDNTAYWSEVKQHYAAEREKFVWLRETQERVKKEMDLARGNVELLHSLLQRQEAASPLSVSVCDSCKYHKVKLSRLIGDICAAPEERTAGTVLDSESGSLFLELFRCNEDVKKVLHAYAESGSEGGGAAPKSVASAPAPRSPTKEAAAPPTSTVASPPQPSEAPKLVSPKAASAASSSAVELSAAGSTANPAAARNSDSDDDEGSFEAQMPWSMDD